MNLRKRIGTIRQAIVWGLAGHIGRRAQSADTILRSDVRRILVTRPNHRLGNLLLITPLLQEIEATFPFARIDVFVKGTVARHLFAQYRDIDTIISLPSRPFIYLPQYIFGWIRLLFRKYDLVINAAHHSSSGRLSTRIVRARFKTYGDVPEDVKAACPDHRHNAKHPVYSLRSYMSGSVGVPRISSPMPLLDLRLTTYEHELGRKLLRAIVPISNPIISIFTHATREKCLSCEWWQRLLAGLQARYGTSGIVEILPVENVSQVGFAVPSFYSRDVREIGAVIANTDVFIGADSGMMHLASASQTPVVGLFSVTDPAAFGPYGNGSTAIDTNRDSVEDCLTAVDTILRHPGQSHKAIGD